MGARTGEIPAALIGGPPMPRVDTEIDRLYQVPLADFTAERNALAKRAGEEGADIRALQKPTVPAWAVNQLYWKQRPVYDELMEHAEDLRATHNAALRGQRTDLRGAGRAHEDAVEAALKATIALLADSGHPLTDATRQAIATTLRALPGDEAPGRLSRQLEPRGFDMLAGGPASGRVRAASPAARPRRETPKTAEKTEATKATAARLAAAREAAAAATRAARDAEHVVRREEFEAARAAREAEKARRRLTDAEDALQQAQAEVADAKRAATAAEKARDTAQARAEKAARELKAARQEEEAARKKLDALT
jgi:hypothetical protein